MFDRDHLATLVAVVDEGSLDAAARRLRITPSAVSQRLKTFEQQVGRVLVVRSRPVRATESGEALLRLARQQALLEHDAAAALGLGPDDGTGAPAAIPLAVNADSLATWILPALASVATERGLVLELHREDQARTADLLAAGTVMAAVTSRADPMPGCTVTRLGRMRYRAVAAPAFVARWFPDGPTPDALALAPVVDFDRDDELQSRFLATVTRRSIRPPRHLVPASADFAHAIVLGLGWGMLPDAQADEHRAAGRLVDLGVGRDIDVPLAWQQWNLRSPHLDALAAAVAHAAATALD